MKMSESGKKVLVTGAGGFIGSHLVEALATQGYQVRAFVRYNSRGDPGLLRLLSPNLLAKIELVAGDLCDYHGVFNAVQGCQIVLHLGALISIPYSYLHPMEVAENNIIGTLNVLMACRELAVERLVHTSTSEVYGTAQIIPISESHPLHAQSPYSASKISADKLAESFYCTYGLPVVILRPFNTFGPRQSARAVIPAIIVQALTQNTIHLGSLETSRDFTFVSDTVHGFLKAITVPGVEGKQFNLGTGKEIKVGDLVRLVIQKIGRPVEIALDSHRLRPEKSEVQRLVSNNQLACDLLEWKPQVTLDQGLDQTIEWVGKHLEQYHPERYEF